MKLNYMCDLLAKVAVNNAIMDSNMDRGRLRLESEWVFIGIDKPTTNVSKDLWHYVGCQEAAEFYAGEGILDQFTCETSNNRFLLPTSSIV